MKAMKIGGAQRLKEDHCTNCGHDVDACSAISETGETVGPSEGDVTICINCGHVMAFNKKRELRELTGMEIVAIAGDERILAIQHVLGYVRKNRVTNH